jgi:hypothetical protein
MKTAYINVIAHDTSYAAITCRCLPGTDITAPRSDYGLFRGGDSFSGCDRKDSWLPRSAFQRSSTLTCGPRIQHSYRTILKSAVRMVHATSARFGLLLVKNSPPVRNSRLESSARPRPAVGIRCPLRRARCGRREDWRRHYGYGSIQFFG